MTTQKASAHKAAPLFLATVSLSLLALHCSSDSGDSSTLGGGATAGTTSGSAGVATQAGSTGVAGMTTGGVATGGSFGTSGTATTAGTTTTAGTATGGSTTAGTGGTAAGSGGTTGGSGGASGSGGAAGGSSGSGGAAGGSGGSSTTFAAVKELMAKSCGTGKCHNADSGELNYQDVANLYKTLTSPVPDNAKHCAGNGAVIKANDTNSLLLKAIAAAGAMCMNKGANQTIGRMPDDCSTTGTNPRPCLTADQIKVFTDWVAAGAPM